MSRQLHPELHGVKKNRFRITKYLSDLARAGVNPRLLDHEILVLQAVTVDTVTEVGKVCDPLDKLHEFPNIVKEWITMMVDKDIQWPPNFDQLKATDPRDAFWRTIINNCVSGKNSYVTAGRKEYDQMLRLWKLLKASDILGGFLRRFNDLLNILLGGLLGVLLGRGISSTNPEILTIRSTKRLEGLIVKETPGLAYYFLICL